MAWYRCGGTPSEVLSLPTPSEASGAIARFNTDLTENLLSAVAEFSLSQASGTPTPSAPIPIVGVNKVAIYDGGKNLIDLSSMVFGYVTATGIFATAHTQGEMRSGFIPVRPNTNYFFSIVETTGTAPDWVGIGLYKDNDVSSFIERKSYWSFTTSADTRFIVVSARNLETATKIQLEEGSTATEYEPYNGTTVIINLGGTYYGGYIDVVTGKITLTHKIETIPTKTALTPSGSHYYVGTTYADMKNVGTTRTDDIKSEVVPFNNVLGDYFCYYHIQNICVIGVPDNYTIEEYNQNIAGTKIVYPLATPIVVYASNTAEIPTIVGENQVFADTGDVAVKFLETVGHKI